MSSRLTTLLLKYKETTVWNYNWHTDECMQCGNTTFRCQIALPSLKTSPMRREVKHLEGLQHTEKQQTQTDTTPETKTQGAATLTLG